MPNQLYKITLLKQVKYIWISLMFFLISPGIFSFLWVTGEKYHSIITILLILVILGPFYIPGFVLHLSYYLNDRRKKIFIDEAKNVTILDESGSFLFSVADIETITNHHSGLQNRTPWNDYEFSVFNLKNGEMLIVTCLLLDLDKIDYVFPREIIIRKNHFISTLKNK